MSENVGYSSLSPATAKFGHSSCTTSPKFIDAIDWPVRRYVTIKNDDGGTKILYVGLPGAAASGFALHGGQQIQVEVNQLHALEIVASDTLDYSWSVL